jgi:hypothetical protein
MSRLHYNWMVGPVALVLFALLPLAAGAQNQPDQQSQQGQSQPNQNEQNSNQSAAPIPAYHSPFASGIENSDSSAGTEDLEPDTRALSGVQTLSLGGLKESHSYWQPHVDISGSADSNVQQSTSGSQWGSWATFSGGVDVHHVSSNNDLMFSYTGGGMFSSDTGTSNGMVQELGFSERLALRRWTVGFFDQFSYFPESAFGFGGSTGVPFTGGTNAGIGSSFSVGQTLLVGQGRTVSNSLATEGDYALSPRSSITLAGGYGLLNYPDNSLLNAWTANARIGYNYLLTQKDTLALLYTYSAFRYNNYNQFIDTHSVQISYGRRVTGRLAFQISAGPEIALSRLPISGTPSAAPTTNSTELFWSLQTSTQYQLRRVGLNLTYDHGVSSGSGVLAGSISDNVQGSATRQMSPTFSSELLAGYSRNSGLAIGVFPPTNQSYNYWYVGTNLNHPWGNVGVTFSYQLQYQDSNGTFCTGANCGTSLIRNVISLGVGWHGGRMLFR